MIWKHSGCYGELQPKASEGLRKTEILYAKHGEDVFVTHIRDAQHGTGTLHTDGRAWDQRKGKVPLQAHKEALGKDFDVIDETTHRHVEYDPK